MTCLSRTYFITAPNRVRPGQVLQVFVSVFELTHPHLIVSAAVRREQHEVCSATKSFLPGSSSLMQMQVRAWPPSCLFTNVPFNEIGCKCFVQNQVSVRVHDCVLLKFSLLLKCIQIVLLSTITCMALLLEVWRFMCERYQTLLPSFGLYKVIKEIHGMKVRSQLHQLKVIM